MNTISITMLGKHLEESGYLPEHVGPFLMNVDHLLQKGHFKINDETIGCSVVQPRVKVNKKSTDVKLVTSGVRNVLRIHHPSNKVVFNERKNPMNLGCIVCPQKVLSLNWNDPERGKYTQYSIWF